MARRNGNRGGFGRREELLVGALDRDRRRRQERATQSVQRVRELHRDLEAIDEVTAALARRRLGWLVEERERTAKELATAQAEAETQAQERVEDIP